jgi:hypothetical protein
MCNSPWRNSEEILKSATTNPIASYNKKGM